MREGIPLGAILISAVGSPSFYREADCSSQDLRRSGGHRDRERASVQELEESLEQQTATSEILGVIASSPTDIQPVMDVVAANAARFCSSNDAVKSGVRGGYHSPHRGLLGRCRVCRRGPTNRRPPVCGRAGLVDQRTVGILTMLPVIETEFPESWETGVALVLAACSAPPGAASIGAIHIRRTGYGPLRRSR